MRITTLCVLGLLGAACTACTAQQVPIVRDTGGGADADGVLSPVGVGTLDDGGFRSPVGGAGDFKLRQPQKLMVGRDDDSASPGAYGVSGRRLAAAGGPGSGVAEAEHIDKDEVVPPGDRGERHGDTDVGAAGMPRTDDLEIRPEEEEEEVEPYDVDGAGAARLPSNP